MSNLQANCRLNVGFYEVGYHIKRWKIVSPRHKTIAKLSPAEHPNREYEFDAKRVYGNKLNSIFKKKIQGQKHPKKVSDRIVRNI